MVEEALRSVPPVMPTIKLVTKVEARGSANQNITEVRDNFSMARKEL